MHTCQLCNKQIDGIMGLNSHVRNKHKMSMQQYREQFGASNDRLLVPTHIQKWIGQASSTGRVTTWNVGGGHSYNSI